MSFLWLWFDYQSVGGEVKVLILVGSLGFIRGQGSLLS